ncbi:MAG: HD domain-containing protein [Oscillospiraceae bacterium]|nr:HD domain-containing protein [Oscillospiraceae bacterium]
MKKDAFVKLSEIQIGETIHRPVLVSNIAENVSKNGKPFLRVTLKDGYGEQVAMMFDASAQTLAANNVYKDTVADVTVSVSEYQGSRSYKIMEIAPASDTSLTIGDFTKLPPIDLDVMYDEICEILKSTADDCGGTHTPLADLALRILNDHKKAYMTSSAAVSMHHNLRGGLLYHSYRMVKAADALCTVYTNLDRELLLCGAALHDIGKIWEYKTSQSGEAEFTPSGILMGHLYMGASLIKGYTTDQNYHKEKVQLLIHLILSHHGTLEFGAVTCPAIPEALVLHHVDNIDAKMYMFEDHYETLEPGGLSEKKPFGLDNRIYKPNM